MRLKGATRQRYETKARMMRALAHTTRLFMVEELSKSERCVCELRDMVGADISTVSKHLALLKAAGIVADDKRGLQVFYRLKTPCVLGFPVEPLEDSENEVRPAYQTRLRALYDTLSQC